MRKLYLIALGALTALTLVGCTTGTGFLGMGPARTQVSQVGPRLWHIESGEGAPETWLPHTCATRGEAVLRIAPTPGDEGYGLNVWCAKVKR